MSKGNASLGLKDWIALAVIITSGSVLLGAAVVAMAKGDATVSEAVFLALLPVVGTWVGTVLAYYFSRENFKAASESMERVVELSQEERLQLVTIREAWITVDEATKVKLGDRKLGEFRLSELDDHFTEKVTRLPVLDKAETCLCVVHRSMVSRFREESQEADPTLEQLLEHEKIGPKVKLLAHVAVAKKLAAAKDAMFGKPGCQDVIVTRNGNPDEPMLGWITNTRLVRHSKA
jgi:hypothetical protein